MIQIDTNTQTEAEVRGAFVANGFEPKIVEPSKKPEATKPADKPAEPVGEPGDKIPAETAGDTTVVAGEEKPTQEIVPAPTQITEPNKKAKGGFQAKVGKLTSKIDHLQEELDTERGDRTRIAAKLAEAQEELTKLKGGDTKVEPTKETGPVRPKRPEMPDLAEMEYDQDKFQAAMKVYRGDMTKYDEELDTYQTAIVAKAATDAVQNTRQKDEEARVERENIKKVNAFIALRDKDAEEVGKEETLEEIRLAEEDGTFSWPADLQVPILESEIPGHLMIYLYEHPEELERVSGYTDHLGRPNPVRMVRELGKIEDKLLTEVTARRNGGGEGKQPEPKPVAAAAAVAATETVPPAKPRQRAETPEAPIRPVGARVGAGSATADINAQLDAAAKAGDSKEFRRLRALQHQEAQAKKTR